MARKRHFFFALPLIVLACSVAGGIFGPHIPIASAATATVADTPELPVSKDLDEFTRAYALIEQNAAFAIVAVGALIGIVSRCVDISPGSVVALGAVVAALTLQAGFAAPAALLAGVLACLIVYGLNGLLVGRLRLEPLIVTLLTLPLGVILNSSALPLSAPFALKPKVGT